MLHLKYLTWQFEYKQLVKATLRVKDLRNLKFNETDTRCLVSTQTQSILQTENNGKLLTGLENVRHVSISRIIQYILL